MHVFSTEWAQAYKEAINANPKYEASSKNWEEGSVALILTDGERSEGVLLELLRGKCLSATRMDGAAAREAAAFAIEGDQATWQEVLGGKLAPLMGIMRGRLKLSKGNIAKLLPYTQGAAELVASAQTLDTEF